MNFDIDQLSNQGIPPSVYGAEQVTQTQVSVIIVNYRTAILTISSVESVLTEPEIAEIIVVDSGSGNGDFEAIESRFAHEAKVRLIKSDENIGFGKATNLGFSIAISPFLFLLNSDAVVRPGCLGALLSRWSKLADPGVLAPQIYIGDTDRPQAETGGDFPTVIKLFTRRTKRFTANDSPEWVTGCAMLLHRDVFLGVGGFDDDIFMYYEDVLLCWKIRQAGLKVYRCDDAAVGHLGSQSSSAGLPGNDRWYKSQEIALRKMGQPPVAIQALKVVRRLRNLAPRPHRVAGRTASPRVRR